VQNITRRCSRHVAAGKPLPKFNPLMFLLATGLLPRASMGPSKFILNMLGEQQLCALVLVFSAMLHGALSLALVLAFGGLGAAAAASIWNSSRGSQSG
jgi:O-antigen/teichoic acid export membrane protein